MSRTEGVLTTEQKTGLNRLPSNPVRPYSLNYFDEYCRISAAAAGGIDNLKIRRRDVSHKRRYTTLIFYSWIVMGLLVIILVALVMYQGIKEGWGQPFSGGIRLYLVERA
ncbi:MAG: hypothetical protein ABIH84_00200, partial [bacterium]